MKMGKIRVNDDFRVTMIAFDRIISSESGQLLLKLFNNVFLACGMEK